MAVKGEKIYFEGKCKWASIPPNKARSFEDEEKTTYSIAIACDQKKYDELIKKGMSSLTKLREEDEGTYLTLRATKYLPATSKRDAITFEDIVVQDIKGNAINYKLANGSTVKCAVETAPSKKGIVLRLLGVQVLNGIEFTEEPLFGDITTAASEEDPAPFDTSDIFK